MARQIYVTLLLLKGESAWVAQCLEYDIAAQGKDLKAAIKSFEKTFVGQMVLDIDHGKEPLQDIGQAPQEFWAMFEQAEKLKEPKPFKLPEFLPGFLASATQAAVCG